MELLHSLANVFIQTVIDVVPIATIIFGFQLLVIRKPIPHLKTVLFGFFYVLIGLTFFLEGLELALFPMGKLMAAQLTDPAFIFEGLASIPDVIRWQDYMWVYIFAAAIGFSTTIAEPSLIA
ncbi:MAG TPA: DUF1538 domain-containing protein, partial [Methylophaga sp.]|nr:DUF1538 domain-containing protein [Methylophaga sp.]